jgi:hypothetical protein
MTSGEFRMEVSLVKALQKTFFADNYGSEGGGRNGVVGSDASSSAGAEV